MNSKLSIMRESGSDGVSLTIANGNTSVAANLAPALFQRTLALSGAYEYYRFVDIEVEIQPGLRRETNVNADTSALACIAGYVPEVSTATTTSLSYSTVASLEASKPWSIGLEIYDTSNSRFLGLPGHTVSQFLRVPRKVLLSTPTKWFRVASDTEDAETVQGQLLLACNNAAGANQIIAYCRVRYTIEFAGKAKSASI